MQKKVFEIGSEYDWESNTPFLSKNKNDFSERIDKSNVRLLRSGRDAIRYVARICKEKYQTVLMPALMCSCVPQQFEEEGYRIVYYSMNPDFTVNMNEVEYKLMPNCIFFFMNYFGQPFMSKEEMNTLRGKVENLIFVEDITHDFLKRKNEELESEFTVCSLRKWMAIPDGGMVVGKEKLKYLSVEQSTYFAELREEAMKQKSNYLHSGEVSQKDCFRATLAKSNEYIDCIDNVADVNDQSVEILTHMDMERMYELRVQNVNILKGDIKPLVTACENSTLYYPIHVGERQSEVQKKMAEHSIYLPVIWPLPEAAKGVCNVADEVANSMLAIPCDHRYNIKDMGRIIDVLKDCI